MSGESLFAALEPLLEQVSKPIQYVGGELNSTVKDWNCGGFGPGGEELTTRWALMYPDAYEVGVPNQGVMILYEVLNERPDALAERTYAVWPDMEALLREHGRARSSPSTATAACATSTCSASRFSTELGYTNMLTALDLAGIPLHARGPRRSRTRSSSPAGTRRSTPSRSPTSSTPRSSATASRPCWRSPTSSATGRPQGRPGGREELLMRLARTGGVYVPAFYDVDYLPDGRIQRVAPGRATACRGGCPSTPSWTSTRGPTRSSRSCRWPSRCTSACRSRSSAAAPAAAGSARRA